MRQPPSPAWCQRTAYLPATVPAASPEAGPTIVNRPNSTAPPAVSVTSCASSVRFPNPAPIAPSQ